MLCAVDGKISAVERQVLDAAEAMPEDKFNFSPDSLSLPGSNYKGVRTFAVQVKHIAASNYSSGRGSPAISCPPPVHPSGGQ